jgi:tetratricopeptide (TPR) repeat protein
MKSVASARTAFFVIVLIIFSVFPCNTSFAHISADNMPDAVAEMEYRIFLEFKPDDTQVRNKLGMVYFRRKKLAEAQGEFTRILKQDPDNFDALDGMGLVRAAREEYDAAVRYYRQALAVNAEDMMALYHLGAALEKKGDLKEAAEAYRTALELFNRQESAEGDDAFGKKLRQALESVVITLQGAS